MSRRVGNVTTIEPTNDERCELCGEWEECRPYGPNGENVCFSCGMKDAATAERRMNLLLYGEGNA